MGVLDDNQEVRQNEMVKAVKTPGHYVRSSFPLPLLPMGIQYHPEGLLYDALRPADEHVRTSG